MSATNSSPARKFRLPLKKILIGFAMLFVAIQFYRPARNESSAAPDANDITMKYAVPANVQQILRDACYDCHSNNTHYPWYNNIQPVASWMANHVEEAKSELNFNEFGKRRIALQNHKLEEIIDEVKEGEMPLSSYTWMHSEAKLSPEQRQAIINWASGLMDTLKASYPPDSLMLKKKQY